MASRTLLLLGLLLSVVLLISSEVAARELTEEAKVKKDAKDVKEETVEDAQKKGAEEVKKTEGVEDAKYGDQYPGGGYGGYPGRGYGGYPGRGYGGYPGRGYGGYPGGGYGHGGGYCRWGCCGHGYYGRGCRCCSFPGEVPDAADVKAETHN